MTGRPTPTADLDDWVAPFEAAWAAGPPSLNQFLPPADHPDHLPVLAELVRVDLEFRADRGEPPAVDRYRVAFPNLFADPARAREVEFEADRLRAAAETPTDVWRGVPAGPTRFPEPGEAVLDFRLVRELGRGAFGRVFLAEQGGLAGRPVAVKVTTRDAGAEPATLARLQHAHIVPIHSAHQAGGLHLLVMPYLGGTTLADVLAALRQRGSWPATGRELADTLSNRLDATAPTEPAGSPPPKPGVAVAGLARFTFPEAVLWVGARLAEALAHAHDRGIVHRDLKPANVLLADDGRPMLLDFNLAGGSDAAAGGTPAYMAPEQLRALRGGGDAVGPAADLYALGLVLFELLTGRPPFPGPPKGSPDPVRALAAGRTTPPQLRPLAPGVSPSAEAIVRRCLHPDPARRYPSAEALADDLNRQLADRPLAHTREPSVRERVRKWRRRNPRLTVAAVVLVAAAAAVWQAGRMRQGRVRAVGAEYAAVRAGVPAALEALGLHTDDARRRPAALGTLAALEGMARPDLLSVTDRAERDRAVAELRRLTTDGDASDRDDFHDGLRLLRAGDSAKAVERLRVATAADPADYWPWLALGAAHARLNQFADAEHADQVCIALIPAYPMGYHNRGLVRLQQSRFAEAEVDFTAAIRRRPEAVDSHAGRAQARLALGRPAEAVEDLTEALNGGAAETRLYLLRAKARTKAGDAAGAAADRREGLCRTPADAASWVERGLTKLTGDPAGAVADFDAALALDPRSYPALRGKAQALDAGLRREAESLAVVDRTLALFPHDGSVRAGRAVLLARRGDRAAAHADAERCLADNLRAFERYQLAGVYAQTSRTHPADVAVCLHHLSAALHAGAGWEFVDDPTEDPDLDPVRGRPEFRAIVDAAKLARPAARD